MQSPVVNNSGVRLTFYVDVFCFLNFVLCVAAVVTVADNQLDEEKLKAIVAELSSPDER